MKYTCSLYVINVNLVVVVFGFCTFHRHNKVVIYFRDYLYTMSMHVRMYTASDRQKYGC